MSKNHLVENIKFRQVGTATNKRTCGCLCRALQILLRCRRLRWLPKETGGSAAEEAETTVIRRLPEEEEEAKPTETSVSADIRRLPEEEEDAKPTNREIRDFHLIIPNTCSNQFKLLHLPLDQNYCYGSNGINSFVLPASSTSA